MAGAFRFDLSEVLDVRRTSASALATDYRGSAVIVDPAVAATGSLGPLIEHDLVITTDPGEPTVDGVRRVVDEARGLRPQTIIAVGGGSTIDTGKIAATLVQADTDVSAHLLSNAPLRRGAATIAVPTTAGAGAEATRTCVVSNGGRKTWLWDDALRVDTVVVDAGLTIGLPSLPTIASGLDAFVHAVEAASNTVADGVSERAAVASVTAIVDALPRVVTAPDDRRARLEMMLAATSAGVAIDRSGTALAHCVGHALAAFSRIPHGLAVALALRATIGWSMSSHERSFEALAVAAGRRHAHELVEVIDELFDRVGFDSVTRPFRADHIDPVALAAEMQSVENRSMALVNARPPGDLDWLELAMMVSRWWGRP